MGMALSTMALLVASTLTPGQFVPPQLPPEQHSALDISSAWAEHNHAKFDEQLPVLKPADSAWLQPRERPALSMGPIRAQLGGMPGERMRFATFKLSQGTLFGADVGASVDGRSARVLFKWQTGN
jgi:hypothetical protein